MAKAKYEEIDLISCSYEDFRAILYDLGLENFHGDIVERIESLDDENVKEFLMLSNGLEVDQNDAAKEFSLPLRLLSYALYYPCEDRDAKIAYMVRNNLLQDKMILQRDNNQFYGFLPEAHRGLTLLEHAIIKHHFELAKAIGDRLLNIDQSKLSAEEKEILASQIELHDYYQESINRKFKVSELDVFPRTYTYRKALFQEDKKLKQALIAAALPLNLKTIQHYCGGEEYKDAVNPYNYITSDQVDELIRIFRSSGLSVSDLAYITDNRILFLEQSSDIEVPYITQLEEMRIEYLSQINIMRIYSEMKRLKKHEERDKFIYRLILTAEITDRLDILDIVFFGILKNRIRINDKSLIDLLFISCAGWKPRWPEILERYKADLQPGQVAIMGDDSEKIYELTATKMQIDILQYLINHCGANIDFQNKDNKTALIVAAEKGYLEVVKFLIDRGEGNIDHQDYRGQTALMHAIMNSHLEVLKFLIDKRANLDIQDKYDSTALILAAQRGDIELVRLLIAKGANLDIQGLESGETALIRAIDNDHLDVVQYLVERGANMDMRDSLGNTGLSLALKGNKDDIAKILIKAGAHLDFDIHQNLPPALKELVMKHKKEKKDHVLKNLREVKDGKASFDSLNSEALLAIKNTLLSNIQKLGVSKLVELLVNDKISDKALLLRIIGLDLSSFDQAQINKLVKTATKITDKGIKENIDPELVVNQLAEQLALKAEMIKIRTAKTEDEERAGGFAAKVSSQQAGAGKSL